MLRGFDWQIITDFSWGYFVFLFRVRESKNDTGWSSQEKQSRREHSL